MTVDDVGKNEHIKIYFDLLLNFKLDVGGREKPKVNIHILGLNN